MHRGWVKLWRKTQDSEHFSMGLKHIGLFDMLLILANRKPGYFLGYRIEPGQYATSVVNLAERVGESRKRLRKILEDLESCGMVKRENRANRFTLITICNWETYQGSDGAAGQTKGQPRANDVPDQVPPTDPRSEKDKKEEKTTQSPVEMKRAQLSSAYGKAVADEWARRARTGIYRANRWFEEMERKGELVPVKGPPEQADAQASSDDAKGSGRKKRRGSRRPKPPASFEQWQAYFHENGYGHVARRAWDHYAAADWHDTNGRPVLSWKQKARVWFDAERNPPPGTEDSKPDLSRLAARVEEVRKTHGNGTAARFDERARAKGMQAAEDELKREAGE